MRGGRPLPSAPLPCGYFGSRSGGGRSPKPTLPPSFPVRGRRSEERSAQLPAALRGSGALPAAPPPRTAPHRRDAAPRCRPSPPPPGRLKTPPSQPPRRQPPPQHRPPFPSPRRRAAAVCRNPAEKRGREEEEEGGSAASDERRREDGAALRLAAGSCAWAPPRRSPVTAGERAERRASAASPSPPSARIRRLRAFARPGPLRPGCGWGRAGGNNGEVSGEFWLRPGRPAAAAPPRITVRGK